MTSSAGGPRETLCAALGALETPRVALRAVSRFFLTPAFPAGSGPDFVNAAAILDTDLTAPDLLAHLHGVEAQFGRVRKDRWDARTLDIDLLALGDQVLPDAAGYRHWADLPPDRQRIETPDRLILPHPRLQDRAFVLVPLADIAAGWHHPVTGRSLTAMLAALPQADRDGVRPL